MDGSGNKRWHRYAVSDSSNNHLHDYCLLLTVLRLERSSGSREGCQAHMSRITGKRRNPFGVNLLQALFTPSARRMIVYVSRW